MKQYKINQVFLDTENFPEPKRLKCVEEKGDWCVGCAYEVSDSLCDHIFCSKIERMDESNVYFIETDEPLIPGP